MDGIFPGSPAAPAEKACRQCGLCKPLACFTFLRKPQAYRTTCKDCRAAWLRAYRRNPQHAERLRAKERARSAARRPAIRAWERAHPEQLRPGRQRRAARRLAKRVAARAPNYRPLLGPFRAVLPPEDSPGASGGDGRIN